MVALGAVPVLVAVSVSPSAGQDKPVDRLPDDLPLSATFVTEGTVPVTEIEGGFAFTKSDTDRAHELGVILAYAWGPAFGLKLGVPLAVNDPRDDASTVAGIGDVALLGKSTLVLLQYRLAVGTAVKVTLPTGSKSRGLGGMLAIAPGLLAGTAWKRGDTIAVLQADAFYSWQLNEPAPIDAEDPVREAERPEREQRLSANLTAALAPMSWLTGIVELNTVTLVAGDPELRHRVQLYATPGVSVEPAPGWSIRAGVQMPLTTASEFDYRVIVLVTKSF